MTRASESVVWILNLVDMPASLFVIFVFFVAKPIAVSRFKQTL
jgi:hypothetical protein